MDRDTLEISYPSNDNQSAIVVRVTAENLLSCLTMLPHPDWASYVEVVEGGSNEYIS